MIPIRSPGSILTFRSDSESRDGVRVAEGDVAKLHVADADLGDDAAQSALPLVLCIHHVLERGQRRERLLAARDEESELADRLERAARDHDDRDDRAHRHLASLEAVEAAHQQADADRLLRDAGEVDRDRGELAHPLARRRAHRRIAAPAAEHLPFGARGLERLRARDRFDQHRMLQARIRLRVERHPAHLPLQAEPRDEHHGNARERHEHQPAADQRDEGEEQDHEGEIDREHDRGRREEVADHFIVGHAPGERAGAALPVGHRQVHHLLEQLLRKPCVELARDLVDQPRARDPKREIEDEREEHAEREHPQGRHRLVRNHAVVHVHREQRHREGEQVDDQRRQKHRPELAADLPDFGPEPVAPLGFVPRPLVLALAGRDRFRRRPRGRCRRARARRA